MAFLKDLLSKKGKTKIMKYSRAEDPGLQVGPGGAPDLRTTNDRSNFGCIYDQLVTGEGLWSHGLDRYLC